MVFTNYFINLNGATPVVGMIYSAHILLGTTLVVSAMFVWNVISETFILLYTGVYIRYNKYNYI